MDLKQIKLNYARMETYSLEKLVNEIEGLRKEVIPLLKAELEKRNEDLLVLQINEFEEKKENTVKFEDKVDIDQHVKERLDRGEAMESIVDDLKDKGVDLLSLALESSLQKENVTEEIFNMRSSGYTNTEVKQEMYDKYNLDETAVKSLESRIKIKSRNNIIVGILSIIGGFVYFFGGIYVRRFYYLSIAIIIFGIGRLFKGFNQKKNLETKNKSNNC